MCRLLLMTVACLLVLFGTSGLWMMPRLVQQKIEQRLQLKIGTKTFDRFTKVPIPLTVKFYLFNVTNGERVLQGLERPQFREVGPFMFKQWRRREIVDFEDYNRRLRYREIKTFIPMFNASLHGHPQQLSNMTSSNVSSSIPLDPYAHNITIVNLPLLSVLTVLAKMEEGSLKRQMASMALARLIREGGDKILVTRAANQLLFDGYKVSFMDKARDLISDVLGYNFESPLPRNMFGFFFNKNDTWNRREGGELTVFTGRNDSMNDFMLIDNWNDQRQLNVWPTNTRAGNRCNEIRGTDGSQFHPGASKQQVLEIFSPMICSSIQIRYREDTQTRDIPLMRFTTPPDLFAAPKKNLRNACYCTIPSPNGGPISTASPNQVTPSVGAASGGGLGGSGTSGNRKATITDGRCYLDGLLDLSLCQRGAPIAASSPHFYQGDPMLAQAAGLKPEKEKHETYIDIEPMTGSVFRATSRAQLNAYIEEAALQAIDSSIIGRMEPMVAPLVWLEESAEIDEKSSVQFKKQLLNVVQKSKRTFWIAILVGFLLALVVSLQYWYVTCYKSNSNKNNRTSRRTQDQETEKDKLAKAIERRKLKREDRRRSSRLQGNLAANAQASNFLVRQKAALGDQLRAEVGDTDDADDNNNNNNNNNNNKTRVASAVIAAAVALGAGSANAARRRRQDSSDKKEDDEQDDSKRELVANEWLAGRDASQGTTPATSSSGGLAGGRDNRAASEDEDEQRQDRDGHEDEQTE